MSNQSCLHAISERSQKVSVYDSSCAADFRDLPQAKWSPASLFRTDMMIGRDANQFDYVEDKEITLP